MSANTKPKQSLAGIELVRLLNYEGDRIFTMDRARELAPRVGLKDAYLAEALYHLRNNNWIVSLRRGLYAISPTVPGVAAAHEFEIAMALVAPAMISHWSAMHYHGLTEQIPRQVFVLSTTGTSIPRRRKRDPEQPGSGFTVGDTTYKFVQVKPEHFFGDIKVWVGEGRVSIANLERALLDGLSKPQYCGGIGEAIYAFQKGADRLNMDRIVEYAIQLGETSAKRLGWALETQGISSPLIEELAALPIKGYRKLDPTGPRKGSYNSRWKIQENLPGTVST